MTEMYTRLRLSLMSSRADSQPVSNLEAERKSVDGSSFQSAAGLTASGSPLSGLTSSPQDNLGANRAQVPYSITEGAVVAMNGSVGGGSNANSPAAVHTGNSTGSRNAQAQGGSTNSVKSCAGCGGRIIDRFLLFAMERYWHTGCLKCSCCQAQLGEIGTSCFTKSGMILCKNDYIRLFGSSGTCAACTQSIPASEFVMRAQGNVYHLNCFTCVACSNRLVPGDRYSLINGSLICEHDYPKVLKGHTQIPLRSSHKVC